MKRSLIKVILVILLLGLIQNCQQEKQKTDARQPQNEYNKEHPGRWENLVDQHDIYIEVYADKTQNNIIVYIPLKSEDKNHYIERIGIFDKDKRDLTGISFGPQPRKLVKAVLTLYPVPLDQEIKVYAKCSKHDLWTKPLSEAVQR